MPPHIDRCMRIPMHVSGLLMPTEKRLHAGYVQKAEARKNITITTLLHIKLTLVVYGDRIIFPVSSYVQLVLWHSILNLICLS